jgi:hypothetical protein
MAVKRRKFLGFLIGSGAALTAPLMLFVRKRLQGVPTPRRLARALRRWRYPGPIKPLDDREIAKPSRWAG